MWVIEGEVEFHEQEGGFGASATTIGGKDLTNWLCEVLGGNCDAGGRFGVPDQKLEGRYRITVEKAPGIRYPPEG